MKKYNELEMMFKEYKYREIDTEPNAKKFYYIRSISRSSDLSNFCNIKNLDVAELNNKDKLEYVLSSNEVSLADIENFINQQYDLQLRERNQTSEQLVRELNLVQDFNWGGSFVTSLESNIVNNYVKKITSYT